MFKLERTARLSVWARAPVYYIAWAKPVSLYFLKGKKFQKLNAANMFENLGATVVAPVALAVTSLLLD
jgi:hypothetical protein